MRITIIGDIDKHVKYIFCLKTLHQVNFKNIPLKNR